MPTNQLDDDDPIARAFWDFHNKNPEIYEESVRISKQLKGRGDRKSTRLNSSH